MTKSRLSRAHTHTCSVRFHGRFIFDTSPTLAFFSALVSFLPLLRAPVISSSVCVCVARSHCAIDIAGVSSTG